MEKDSKYYRIKADLLNRRDNAIKANCKLVAAARERDLKKLEEQYKD